MSKPEGKLGGVQAVVKMLEAMDPKSREKLLMNIAREDPALAIEIEKRLLRFESLLKLEDADLQALLRELPLSLLALAMRKVSTELKDKIFRNLPKRTAQSLDENITALGPRRIKEVERAQREILQKLASLLGN